MTVFFILELSLYIVVRRKRMVELSESRQSGHLCIWP